MKKKLLLILFFACIALADTCTDGDCVQTADSVCSPRAKLIGFDITVSLNENSFSDTPINVSSISEFTVFKGQSPPLQSFAMAVDYSDGTPTVLIIGGRPRGVHNVVDCKNTAAYFDFGGQSRVLFVINEASNTTWAYPIPSGHPYYHTLSLINTQSTSYNNTLYIAGGYGYDELRQGDVTWPIFTAIDIPNIITAIKNNASWDEVTSHIAQTFGPGLGVTGGELVYDDKTNLFVLAVGQDFTGDYHGASDYSYYTSQYRLIYDVATTRNGNQLTVTFGNVAGFPADPSLSDSTLSDTFGWEYELHRRDLNVVKTMVSPTSPGFGLYGGVFDPITNTNLFTRPVYWNYDTTIQPTLSGFHQLYNSYDCATLSLFDSSSNHSHIVFFGGVTAFIPTQYYVQQYSSMFQVPWTKNISVLSNNVASTGFNSAYQIEYDAPTSNYFDSIASWGTEARFIPTLETTKRYFNNYDEIIDLTQIPSETTILGTIYGGITVDPPIGSSKPCSRANHRFFTVSITKC